MTQDQKETYKKWKSLVNMTPSELRKFYDSQEGKKAGLSSSEAKKEGIDYGRESARWILRMKATPVKEWTPTMWKWANKQISFISRMSGNKGDLYDEKGNKTRKHTSLLIWGHNPKKDRSFENGGIVAKPNRSFLGVEGGSNIGKEGEFKNALFLEKSGLSNESIRLITGWFRNPYDNLWRFEISDKDAKLDNELINKICTDVQDSQSYVRTKIGKVLEHDSLFKAYPEIKELSIVFIRHSGKSKAQISFDKKNTLGYCIIYNLLYDEYTKEIHSGITEGLRHRLDTIFRARKSAIIHELEHIIQLRERFGTGSSAIQEFKKLLERKQSDGREISDSEKADLLLEAERRYLVSSGEIESREVEKRIDFDQEQLKIHVPFSEIDFTGEAIVRFGNNEFKKGGEVKTTYKSNLTPEQQKLVRTPEFKAWFGDWENDPENASKVVDENGEPLVVYHGTPRKEGFYMFDKHKVGHNTYNALQGFYFSDNINVARSYTYDQDYEKYLGRIITAFLNIKEISFIDVKNVDWVNASEKERIDEQIKNLLQGGYDGVVIKNISDPFIDSENDADYLGNTYVVNHTNQIKLADGTNTTFDGNNPDIRYENGGEVTSNKETNMSDKIYFWQLTKEQSEYVKADEKDIESFLKNAKFKTHGNQMWFPIRRRNEDDETYLEITITKPSRLSSRSHDNTYYVQCMEKPVDTMVGGKFLYHVSFDTLKEAKRFVAENYLFEESGHRALHVLDSKKDQLSGGKADNKENFDDLYLPEYFELPKEASISDLIKKYDEVAGNAGTEIKFKIGDRNLIAKRKFTYAGGGSGKMFQIKTNYIHIDWVDDFNAKYPLVYKSWNEKKDGKIIETTHPTINRLKKNDSISGGLADNEKLINDYYNSLIERNLPSDLADYKLKKYLSEVDGLGKSGLVKDEIRSNETYKRLNSDYKKEFEKLRSINKSLSNDPKYKSMSMIDRQKALSRYKEHLDQKINEIESNQIKGGLADNKTIEQIAKEQGVELSFAKEQLEKGIKVEMEHTDNPDVAREISSDHLSESIFYYAELEKMEEKLKKSSSQDYYERVYSNVPNIISVYTIGRAKRDVVIIKSSDKGYVVQVWLNGIMREKDILVKDGIFDYLSETLFTMSDFISGSDPTKEEVLKRIKFRHGIDILNEMEDTKTNETEEQGLIDPKSIEVNGSRKFTNWSEANSTLRWVIDQDVWSNAPYKIEFQDGEILEGSIDLEPKSFWDGKNEPLTWHLNTFWGNVSRASGSPLVTPEDVEFAKKIVTKYNIGQDTFGAKKETKISEPKKAEEISPERMKILESALKSASKVKKTSYNFVYDRLLKVAPELLGLLEKAEYTSDIYGKSQYRTDDFGGNDAFMYLAVEGLDKDEKNRYILSISHYYKQQGDMMCDPCMTVRLDPELKTVEALTFKMDGSIGRGIVKEVYGLTKDGKEGVNLQEKKSQNSFLNIWSSNWVKQGHKVEFRPLPEKEIISAQTIEPVIEGENAFGSGYSTPKDETQKKLGQYPIVVQWSEGSGDENIGFDNLGQLEDFFYQMGYTDSPESTYIKNKVWFRGYPHGAIRIDISKSAGDFDPNRDKLLEYLMKDDPNYDWSKYSVISPEDQELIKPEWDKMQEFLNQPKPLEYQKEKYPIVLEWSEGTTDENVGFNSLEELEIFLKSLGYSDVEGTYIKNKIWFKGLRNYVRIDIGKSGSDYDPENQSLLVYLMTYESSQFDWSAFLEEKTPIQQDANFSFFKGISHNYSNQFQLNKAIEEYLDSKSSDYIFSDEEKEFIYGYEGYGGLEKFGATGVGLLFEYYTPKKLIEKMWGLAYKYGFNTGKVLEPSVGVGRFLDYTSPTDVVTAYEISNYSARICKILHPKTNVKVSSFAEHFYKGNTYNPKFEKDFDLVIGNPPYGKMTDLRTKGETSRIGISVSQYEHYFILRGLDCLKSGGLLVYVSTANLFTKGYEKIKEKIAEKADLVDGYLLPNTTFKQTKINTSLIVLRKK